MEDGSTVPCRRPTVTTDAGTRRGSRRAAPETPASNRAGRGGGNPAPSGRGGTGAGPLAGAGTAVGLGRREKPLGRSAGDRTADRRRWAGARSTEANG